MKSKLLLFLLSSLAILSADCKEWVPIFSSSGGSAHVIAAQFLQEELLAQNVETSVVNVTSSKCTISPQIGTFCTNLWDHAQRDGNVKRQIFLLRFQSLFDDLFFFPAYSTFKKTLLEKHELPSRVICTSPVFLSALCKAVLDANSSVSASSKKTSFVDLYMVETPCDEATYYLKPLKKLSEEKSALVRLFTLPPTPKTIDNYGSEENFWFAKTGLSQESGQVIYDPPCRTSFKRAENLPKPGDALQITLKAQNAEEKEFLHTVADHVQDEDYLFNIRADDRIGLIMMGGFPCEEALFSYLSIAMNLQQEVKERAYLFISCGSHRAETYVKALKKLHNEGPLHIIPFTNQPIENIFARSDFTLTRSGGMTTQEILALKTNENRYDPKTILIHSQVSGRVPLRLPFYKKNVISGGFSSEPLLQKLANRDSYEEQLIQQGIPLWEGGNARYLKERIKEVRIICPSSAQLVLKEQLTNLK